MTLEPTLDVSVDHSVEFIFQVTNTDREPHELQFNSGLVADFAVFDPTGDEIWRWSDSRAFTQAVVTMLLAPDETIEQTAMWEDPPRGEYAVVATLETDRAIETETNFDVR